MPKSDETLLTSEMSPNGSHDRQALIICLSFSGVNLDKVVDVVNLSIRLKDGVGGHAMYNHERFIHTFITCLGSCDEIQQTINHDDVKLNCQNSFYFRKLSPYTSRPDTENRLSS